MAIQAQTYAESSGFPLYGVPEWGGGGGLHDGMCSSLQRQQMLAELFQSQTPNPRIIHFLNHVADDTQGEKQRLEIDRYIHDQSERLRRVFREQRKLELEELVSKIERRTNFLLRQKDVEIAKAAIRTSQLESLLVRLQDENLTWQQLARQNELQVISLNDTIAQLQHSVALYGGERHHNKAAADAAAVEDAESCCDEQQSCFNGDRGLCKVCQTRELGVVFLPCRHLCSCIVCDSMIDICPVCQTRKKTSIEALFH